MPTQKADCAIVVGDMNYRLNGNLQSILEAIKLNMFQDLLFND
jgi:hypothetical protein